MDLYDHPTECEQIADIWIKLFEVNINTSNYLTLMSYAILNCLKYNCLFF